MKTTDELCQEIESLRFAVELNVASDLRTIERGVFAHPKTKELAGRMHDAEVRTQIGERALALIAAAMPTPEEPVEDTAVAVYLLLLAGHDEALSEQIAAGLSSDRQWWWARKIADRILSSSSRAASTASRGSLS